MSIPKGLITGLLILGTTGAFAQSDGDSAPRGGAGSGRRGGFGGGGFGGGIGIANPQPGTTLSGPNNSSLTRFSLDFPGGTPRELVAAIQKASGKPLNAIVPEEFANVKLPALKMANVNVAELFSAVMLASKKQVAFATGVQFGGGGGRPIGSYQYFTSAYGFRSDGPLTDETIWYFFNEIPPVTPNLDPSADRTVRFYLLAPYLERGLTVDDITTAIQTGWKMLGQEDPHALSFHKETKLLIAVGEPRKLETIDAVLKALDPPASRTSGPRGNFGRFGGFGGAPATNSTPVGGEKAD